MSDDWKVGDLAVCVESGRQTRAGSTYRVRDICLHGESREGFVNQRRVPNLRFVGVPTLPGRWSGANRFRKILPDEPIACETEFRILLDLSKKRVKA